MVDGSAVVSYAARGWPLLVCHPKSKKPLGRLVPQGVNDATTDVQVIMGWLAQCPGANLAVACGAPGPQVLDLDYPDDAPPGVIAAARKAPRVASARTPQSGHAYFAGTEAGTIVLDYGELRGVGHYAMLPPSIHPTGKQYVWVAEPRGPLPALPGTLLAELTSTGKRAGTGEHDAPADLICHGHRHPYLIDFAVRLVRAGIIDRHRLIVHLRSEFELSCEPLPPPTPGYFEALASWGARSQIADRERQRAEFTARWSTPAEDDQ